MPRRTAAERRPNVTCARSRSANSGTSDQPTAASFRSMSVYDLRQTCRTAGLASEGTKNQLINCLCTHHGVDSPNANPRRVTVMRTTLSGIHIRSDDNEKKLSKVGPQAFSVSPLPLSLSLSLSSLSLSLFLFPSLSEEVIQVDLPHAGVGPHTQDAPFKIKKNPSNFSVQSALADQKRNERPSTSDISFHFWS